MEDFSSKDTRAISHRTENRTTLQNELQEVTKRVEKYAGPPLAAVIGGSIGGVVVLCLIFTAVILILRQRKRRTFNYNDVTDYQCHSAPLSRQSSPLPAKRGSCPDLRRDRQGSAIARSLTAHNIPDFTLPPERVQPTSPHTSTDGKFSPCHNKQCMLGTVQPELYVHYPYSEDIEDRLPLSQHGRLWFSLIYDAAVEQLSVTLIKVKQLPARDKGGGMRDPFVKLFLLPDERTCRISKVRRKTLAPMFNETFVFQMPPDDISKRTLRMSVYDVDKRRVRHCLGHVLVPLREVDVTKGDTHLRELLSNANSSASLGDLQFSLTYLSNLTKLKVVLMRCRNLRHCDYEQDSGLFIQVQLLHGRKVVKTKKTAVQQESCDPAVNESFTFSLNGQRLDTCSLLLTLRTVRGRTCRISRSEEYGRVVVGPFMFARGEQLIHWQDMLANPSTAITRWHALSQPPHID